MAVKRPEKIISGGQTGADQGGLVAARILGIPTGGTAPPGYMTDNGQNTSLGSIYGLVEGKKDPSVYRLRTIQNVIDSTGTVWFGIEGSPGGKLTLGQCVARGKPTLRNPSPIMLREWVAYNNITILNVAGNRERKNPGITDRTVDTILAAFREKPEGG